MSDLSKKEAELGTVTAIIKRFSVSRLPRLKGIKEYIDKGNPLTEPQINYLSEVFEDAQRALPYIDEHPELQDSSTKIVALYQAIMEKAVTNEEAGLINKIKPIDFIE